MSPTPNGRLSGNDLTLTRTFRAPIDDVWTSITRPESSARWFGRWEGEPGAGKKIRIQMAFEEGQPWIEDATIRACDAPRHLELYASDSYGVTHLELTLTQEGDTTQLTFVQHLTDLEGLGEMGPGWEYYLDNLVAARAAETLPKFTDYYPSQKAYYVGLRGDA